MTKKVMDDVSRKRFNSIKIYSIRCPALLNGSGAISQPFPNAPAQQGGEFILRLEQPNKMMQEISRPNNKVETLYDKLNNLADEISEGIVNLGDQSRENVQKELSDLRELAYKERSPEAVYNTYLFRKYSNIANKLKDAKSGQKDKSTFVGELPSFVYEADDEEMLVGYQATKSNIFRLRFLVSIFALITFSVMSSASYVDRATFNPNHYFKVSNQLHFNYPHSTTFASIRIHPDYLEMITG